MGAGTSAGTSAGAGAGTGAGAGAVAGAGAGAGIAMLACTHRYVGHKVRFARVYESQVLRERPAPLLRHGHDMCLDTIRK